MIDGHAVLYDDVECLRALEDFYCRVVKDCPIRPMPPA
jgi:hypothetical protein